MKLYSTDWKRVACLFLATIIAVMGTKGTCFAAKTSVYDDELQFSRIVKIACKPRTIKLRGYIWTEVKPTGAVLYRAKIKANGKRGNFKKVGVCKKLKPDRVSRWYFTYEDSTVKAGQAYVYKCKGFRKTGNVKTFQEKDFGTKKGVAANAVGKYTCKVLVDAPTLLMIKLTGKSKHNGILEFYVNNESDYSKYYDARIAYKNKGDTEAGDYLEFYEYSYDGKKWYTESCVRIQGKESVYLRLNCTEKGENIVDLSKYQYVQMMVKHVTYNLCSWNYETMPQLRLNLITGEARTGHFIELNVTQWEDNIFKYQIPPYIN